MKSYVFLRIAFVALVVCSTTAKWTPSSAQARMSPTTWSDAYSVPGQRSRMGHRHAASYRAIEFDPVPFQVGFSIGSLGQIAMEIYCQGGDYCPAVYEDGEVTTLDNFGDAYGVNSKGDVVGDYASEGALWPKHGVRLAIKSPKPSKGAALFAISDSGMAAGVYYMRNHESRCFGWTRKRGSFDFGSPKGITTCFVGGVNNMGQVTGTVEGTGTEDAYIWRKGKYTLLPPLADAPYCTASAMNDAGDVVGSCSNTQVRYPVLWRNGVAVALYSGTGLQAGYASGINDGGVIVGSILVDNTSSAVIFEGDGSVSYLSDLVQGISDRLEYAYGVDDRGDISTPKYELVPDEQLDESWM